MVKRTIDTISKPCSGRSPVSDKSQWIAIAIDQQLGPDTGRVFNDVCVEVAPGNTTAKKARRRSKIPGLRTECSKRLQDRSDR